MKRAEMKQHSLEMVLKILIRDADMDGMCTTNQHEIAAELNLSAHYVGQLQQILVEAGDITRGDYLHNKSGGAAQEIFLHERHL